jgi:hypothetical protein
VSSSISETIPQGLSLLTYNGNSLITPKENQLNIYMGIGLWSVKDGLSEGLPIDVMQMLLAATIMRSQIIKENHGKPSKVILLIADSMAVREGAEKEKVSQIVLIYKKSLEPLLDLLSLRECSAIILSSDLESSKPYEEALQTVESSSIVKQLKIDDEAHYAYIRTQTAISHYMNKYQQVGVKIGWICDESNQELRGRKPPHSLKHWDELKFDRWCEAICQDSTLQYLYVKAGLKQSGIYKQVNVREGCPYTAYPKDQRYVIQTQVKKDIKTICPIQKRVATHWKGIAEVCSSLMQGHIVHSLLLPENGIERNNAIATVYNMLNYWSNTPVASQSVICASASISLMNT